MINGSVDQPCAPFLLHLMNCIIYLLGPLEAHCMCAGDQTLILLLYQRLHQTTYHISVNSIFQKYSSIEIRGKRYTIQTSNPLPAIHCRQSIALVKWDNDLFLDQPTISEETLHHNSNCRPVKVHYFAKVSFLLEITLVTGTHEAVSCLLLYHGTSHIHVDMCLVNQLKYGVPQCLKPMVFILLSLSIFLWLGVPTVSK